MTEWRPTCINSDHNHPPGITCRPQRIQLSRKKGWRMPPNTVKVDRSTRWGNPRKVRRVKAVDDVDAAFWGQDYYWGVARDGQTGPWNFYRTKAEATKSAVALFRFDVIGWDVAELRGKNLACWCRVGEPCHADVLLEIANR